MSPKKVGVRPVFGMSLRSLPKTIRQSHAAEALQLRPFGSQWEQIKRYFATSRRRKYDLRYHVLDAILYIVKTGTQWRMLPGEFAEWQTVYYYFRRWREEGRILCILSITSRAARRRAGQHGEPSALITGCQSVLLREWAEPVASTLSRR
ncbi:transposase [Salinibacter ruber]|uniref:transposase n=1 Tax=Salinibacter ruber TaxID=146919 RepID=UPI00311A976C